MTESNNIRAFSLNHTVKIITMRAHDEKQYQIRAQRSVHNGSARRATQSPHATTLYDNPSYRATIALRDSRLLGYCTASAVGSFSASFVVPFAAGFGIVHACRISNPAPPTKSMSATLKFGHVQPLKRNRIQSRTAWRG